MYSRSLADYLKANGLEVIEVKKDELNPKFLNWKFLNDDKYHQLLDAYEVDKIYKQKGLY